ncbi:MAG: glycosyltransferase family 4 protein [Deltaproteobacteria bacterium]|nr:glycosyltransferase family 4 protein [Deltaproteobacteria bacterium]
MITYTGIGRYIQNLLSSIPGVDRGNTLTAVTCTDAFALPASENLDIQRTALDIPVYSFLKEQVFLSREMNRSRPELFHYPSFNMPIVNPKPSVVTLHDLVYYIDPHSCSRLRHWYARVMFPLAARSARMIITGSEHSKADIVRHLNVREEKVAVIHHGVAPAYAPVTDGRAITEAKARYKINGDYLLYVGSHHPRKNLARLIEAFARIKENACLLVITGAMERRRSSLYGTPASLGIQGRVLFVGAAHEADLPALYSGARAFVIPSLYEGFGLTPLEAMACGTPVISSNATSLPEVVGDAALTFDPLDAEAMSKRMEMVMDAGEEGANVRARLREAGVKRAALFSWKRSAEQTLDVYRKALGRDV